MATFTKFEIIPVARSLDGKLLVQKEVAFPSEEEAKRAGRIFAYGADERMTVHRRRKPRKTCLKSVVAYAGTYTRIGNRLIHHVDISWNEIWTGTDQAREFVFDGKHLLLKTPPTPSPIDGREVEDSDGSYTAELITQPNQIARLDMADFKSALVAVPEEQSEA
jgi:hypothetical protein